MKAVLIGTGWRSRFYLRISEHLPSLLEIVSVYSSSLERAEKLRKEGWRCFSSLDDALGLTHDAVIVATARDAFFHIAKELGRRGEFILSETSFLPLSEGQLKELSMLEGAVMEQYPYDPIYAACIKASESIGDIDQLLTSGLHNHHAAAMARVILSLEDEEPEEVLFFDHPSVILQTGARDTMIINGSKEHYERKLRILKFKSSIFINDFSSNQYHNYLLEKKLEIRGDLGVVTLDGLKRVNAEGYPVFIPFLVHRDTSTWNSNMTISHITLGSDNIYTNPFYPLNLNDDEIGIATIIKNIEEGKEYRKIKDGIADAVLGKLL